VVWGGLPVAVQPYDRAGLTLAALSVADTEALPPDVAGTPVYCPTNGVPDSTAACTCTFRRAHTDAL
jgi:hypothetical protein